MSLADRARAEILDFHEFLTRWMTGRAPRDLAAVDARLRSFDGDFRYVTPAGERRSLDDLRHWFAEGHGDRPELEIRIEGLELRREGPDSALWTYEEHQLAGEERSARLSSVLFLDRPEAPSGVAWFHLHEVWLPG